MNSMTEERVMSPAISQAILAVAAAQKRIDQARETIAALTKGGQR